MTSPVQASKDSDQAPQGAHKPSRSTRRRPAGRFSLPRNKRTWLGITLSLIALAGVALAVRGGSQQANSGNTSAATGVAPGAPATGGTPTVRGSSEATQVNQAPNSNGKTVGTVGKVPSAAQAAENAGALILPANMQSGVIAWQAGPGGKDLAAVTRLFGDALQAGGERQYVEMRFACIQLTNSVSTAEAGPQIPVAAMQMLYGKALAELAKGGADCQAAIATESGGETLEAKVNATMRQEADSELAAGARDIFRSTAEIEIASRQSH